VRRGLVAVSVLVWAAVLASLPAWGASERTFKDVVFDGEQKRQIKIDGAIEYDYKLTLTPTVQGGPSCLAEVAISYVQMHDKVRVDTTIEHDDCAASGGDYTLRMRSTDATGVAHVDEFEESWRRDDSAAVEIRRFYPVDPERELKWMRVRTSRKTNCQCIEAAAEQAEPTATEPSP
jgi:hypothetical protein